MKKQVIGKRKQRFFAFLMSVVMAVQGLGLQAFANWSKADSADDTGNYPISGTMVTGEVSNAFFDKTDFDVIYKVNGVVVYTDHIEDDDNFTVKGTATGTAGVYRLGDTLVTGTFSVSGYVNGSGGIVDNVTLTGTAATTNVTVSGITANSRQYTGDNTATFNLTNAVITGATAGDNVSVSTVTGTFSDAAVGNGKTVNITGITLSGTDAYKYTVDLANSQKTCTADIYKKALDITALTVSKVYDGTTNPPAAIDFTTAAISGKIGTEVVSIDSADIVYTDADVGTNKEITISNIHLTGADAGNYAFPVIEGGYKKNLGTITQRPVTVTAKNQTVPVGGTVDVSLSQATLTGAVDGHTLSAVTLAPNPATTANPTAAGTITPSAAAITNGTNNVTANYSFTYTPGTLVINGAPAHTVPTANDLTYNGTDRPLVTDETATVTGGTMYYRLGDTGSWTTTVPTGKDAGAYTVYYKIVGNAGYPDVAPTLIAGTAIKQKEVTLSWSNTSLTYNGTPQFPTATVTAASVVAGDTCTVTSVVSNVVADPCTDAGNHTAKATGLSNANYKLPADPTSAFTINQAAITVKADDQTVGLGGTLDQTKYSVSSGNLIAGHTITAITITGNTSAATQSGTVSITAGSVVISDGLGNNVTANYNITLTAGTLKVTKGAGDTDPAYSLPAGLTATYGDTVASVALPAKWTWNVPAGTLVGNVGAHAFSATYTPTDANYDTVTKDLTITVSQKEVTVSGITAEDKTYDGTTAAVLNYDNISITGKINGDDLSVTATGTFTDANASDAAKTVNISGLTLTGNDKANYSLAAAGQQATTTAKINKAPINITVTMEGWVYDGNPHPEKVPTVTGNVGGGAETVYYKKQTEDDTAYTATGPTDAGDYTVKVTVGAATNYQSAEATANFTVTKAPNPAVPAPSGKDETMRGKGDGEIWNVDDTMEFCRLDTAAGVPATATWTSVPAGTILADHLTGKNPGYYHFRYKADQNHASSNVGTVQIKAGPALNVVFDPNTTDTTVSGMPAAQQASYNGRVNPPASDPIRTGYDFNGWFKDAGCSVAWNFANDTVTAYNTTIFAKWTTAATQTPDPEIPVYIPPVIATPAYTTAVPTTTPENTTKPIVDDHIVQDTTVPANNDDDDNDDDDLLDDDNDDQLDDEGVIGYYVEVIKITPTEELKNSIVQAAAKIGKRCNIDFFWDIRLFRTVNGEITEQIFESDEPILVTVKLSDKSRALIAEYSDSFDIVRVHDGEIEILSCEYDADTGTVSFWSDKFSNYAMIYDADNNPNTGVPFNGDLFYALLILPLLALVRPRKRNKNKM